MNRIIGFLLIILTLYYVAKFRNNGQDPLFPEKTIKSDTLEAYNVPEYLKTPPPEEFEGTSFEKTVSKIVVNIMKTEKGRLLVEKMLRPVTMAPEDSDFTVKANDRTVIDNLLNIKEVNIGTGRSAVCGHRALVEYRVANMSDLILDKGTKEITLGEGSIFYGLDNVVVGMKEGGFTRALVNHKLAYDHAEYKGKKPINKTNDYKLEVKLIEVISKMDIKSDVRIFDDKISLKFPLMCGDRASFDVKIEELGGKTILNTKSNGHSIGYKLGDSTFPIIFSHSLFNKHDKGSRFVILPGTYLKRFDNNIFGMMNKELIKNKAHYLIEFSNVSYFPAGGQK